MKRVLSILFVLLCLFSLTACAIADYGGNTTRETSGSLHLIEDDSTDAAPSDPAEPTRAPTETPGEAVLDENGHYNSKDEVALYIHLYGHLPANYITKKAAEALGWTGGSIEPYAPGCAIGGGYFGNYEGLLPKAKGRSYTECDIDTVGKSSRGAKRIVFSNDGLIFYTGDHYESFELLYGEVEGW